MRKQVWGAALAFGIAGALIPGGVYISGGQLSALALIQVAVAGGAAALTGGLCWRLALRASNPPPKWLGAWVGGLVGLLAHVPFWYILFLFNWTSAETKNLSHPLHMLSSAATGPLPHRPDPTPYQEEPHPAGAALRICHLHQMFILSKYTYYTDYDTLAVPAGSALPRGPHPEGGFFHDDAATGPAQPALV